MSLNDIPLASTLAPSAKLLRKRAKREQMKKMAEEFCSTTVIEHLNKPCAFPQVNVPRPAGTYVDDEYFVKCCQDILLPRGYTKVCDSHIGMTMKRAILIEWDESHKL